MMSFAARARRCILVLVLAYGLMPSMSGFMRVAMIVAASSARLSDRYDELRRSEQRRLQSASGSATGVIVTDTNLLDEPTDLLRNWNPNGSFSTPHPSDLWAMVLSPEDQSFFLMMDSAVWNLSINATIASAPNSSVVDVTLFSGPYSNDQFGNSGFAIVNLSSGAPRRILYRVNNTNKTLLAVGLEGQQPQSSVRNLSDWLSADMPNAMKIISLASNPRRPILYLSSGTNLFKMDFDGLQFTDRVPLTKWVGPAELSSSKTFRDSTNPDDVRFKEAFLSTYGISSDGKLLYVADRGNNVIRRVETATGAVETIAGRGLQGTDSNTGGGRPCETLLDRPQGLALTSDDCYLFVAEFGGGRILVISFNSTGHAVSVRPIASFKRENWEDWIFFSMAISPQDEWLYVGAYGRRLFRFPINKTALPSCHPHPSPGSSSPPSNGKRIVSITIAVALPLLALFVVLACIIRRFPKMVGKAPAVPQLLGASSLTACVTESVALESSAREGRQGYLKLPPSGLKFYKFSEIASACDEFSLSRLVGSGGAAEVYKGVLNNGEVVAIKLMKGELTQSRFRQFQDELDVLSTLRHSHLCSILGYATEVSEGGGSRSVLVYPFIEGGTLHDRLHCLSALDENDGYKKPVTHDRHNSESPSPAPLRWNDRVAIAVQIAKALRYLHEEVDPPIIHRDVKSKNILLGGGGRSGMRAYLADFGLAKLGRSIFEDETRTDAVETYHVSGTPGYIAPEYYRDYKLTPKNDVYAFGIVLLELVTGHKAFSPNLADEDGSKTLGSWAKRMLPNTGLRDMESATIAVREIADATMEKGGPLNWRSVRRMLELSMQCIIEEPERRPKMSVVLENLAGLNEAPQGSERID
uniref:Receptor-like kinase n=1 Tax=Nitella axillaris TaxID=3151 RepID=A7VM66_9VIRI|nr:receptor-like kinase [Nitella axillaris]